MQINYARYLGVVVKHWALAEQNPAYRSSANRPHGGGVFIFGKRDDIFIAEKRNSIFISGKVSLLSPLSLREGRSPTWQSRNKYKSAL